MANTSFNIPDSRNLGILPPTTAGGRHYRPRSTSKLQRQNSIGFSQRHLIQNNYGSLRRTRSGPELLSTVESEDSETDGTAQPNGVPSEEEWKPVPFWQLAREKRLLALSIAITDFNAMCCMSVLAPFFTREAGLRGANNTISGWIFGIFALVQFILSPVCGKMIVGYMVSMSSEADVMTSQVLFPFKMARTNLMTTMGVWFFYQGGLFFAGGCNILFGALCHIPIDDGGTVFIVYCFVIRVFLAIGCTAMSTASFAITADEFADHASVMFGVMETFCGLGLMVGPALGGFLYAIGGFQLPFYVTGGVMLMTVVFNQCILPHGIAGQVSIKSFPASTLLSIPSIPVVFVALVVVSTVWSAFDPILEPHLRQFNLTPEMIGLLFLLASTTYAIMSPFWGWLSEKVSDSKALLSFGFLMTAAVLCIFGPSSLVGFPEDYSVLWLNILSLALLGAVCSMALVPTFENMLDAAELAGIDDDLGLYCTVAGIWSAGDALGEFIGPSLAGWLWEELGFAWFNTYLAFACLAVSLLLFIMYVVERKIGRMGIMSCRRRRYYPLIPKTEEEKRTLLTDSTLEPEV